MAKGVDWKPVQIKGLSKASQTIYNDYVGQLEAAKKAAKKLVDKLSTEWKEKYPDGKDGHDCRFNILGATIKYTMVPHTKNGPKGKAVDQSEGDNVFA